MIVVRPMESWDVRVLRPNSENILIDLMDARSREDVLQRIGRVLKGSDSPLIHGRSYDAFADVISDWAIEHLRHEVTVYIINLGTANKHDEALAASIISCFHDAILSSFREHSCNDPEFKLLDNINNLRFEMYF